MQENAYLREIAAWAEKHPGYRIRTKKANVVDATSLAIIKGVECDGPKNLNLSYLTATVPLYEATQKRGPCKLSNPLFFMLRSAVRAHYSEPIALINFCYECEKEIIELEHGLVKVDYCAEVRHSIPRKEVKRLVETWKKILTTGHLAILQKFISSSTSFCVDSWICTQDVVREALECKSLLVAVTHTVTKARRLLELVSGNGKKELLSLVGGKWLKPVAIGKGGGTRETLELEVPASEICLEKLDGYYSLYWNADATISVI